MIGCGNGRSWNMAGNFSGENKGCITSAAGFDINTCCAQAPWTSQELEEAVHANAEVP